MLAALRLGGVFARGALSFSAFFFRITGPSRRRSRWND
jgi:hypothetical protein